MQPVVRMSMLTSRQEEIVGLITAGLTNGEIAEQLGLTPGTISEHISNILWCLGLRRRRDIAAWAIEEAWRARSLMHG